MSDFKHLTVRTLRELAREHLGRGHSRLKTKDELVDALKRAVPHVLHRLMGELHADLAVGGPADGPSLSNGTLRQDAEGERTSEGERRSSATGSPDEASASVQEAPSVAEKPATMLPVREVGPVAAPEPAASASVSPSAVQEGAGASREVRASVRSSAPPEMSTPARSSAPQAPALLREAGPIGLRDEVAPEAGPRAPPVDSGFFVARRPDMRATPPPGPEPVLEGFFVARIAGMDESHRWRAATPGPLRDAVTPLNARGEESLGELPERYSDEELVLLPRDPRTLFFFWDFRPTLSRGVAVGLPAPRAVVKILEGGSLVREQEFSLDANRFFLSNLTPGRTYRIECYVRGADGRMGPLRLVSNAVTLPFDGPSENLEVRVMRVPWTSPLIEGPVAQKGGRGHLGGVRTGPLPSSDSIPRPADEETEVAGAGEHLDTPRGPLPSSERILPRAPTPRPAQAPEWLETPHLDLPSSHLRPGGVAALESSPAPLGPEESPPDWARGPHLELPSSHSWRGAPEGLESSPGSRSGEG